MSGLDVHAVLRRGALAIDVAVSAARGETVAIMGPSGAGKSSLLAAIAGLVPLRDGYVRLDGRELSARRRTVPPQRRGVVLLGQDPHLFPHLTARENIAFGPRAQGSARAVALGEADEWLWRIGLPGAGDHRPRELSGGQQQRIALARALATRPSVLLLDEPLTALDPETASDVRTVLAAQLGTTHTTTLLVTHDAVDAAGLASRLVLVEHGRVGQEGSVRDVLERPRTRFGAAAAGIGRVEGQVAAGIWTGGALSVPASGVPEGSAVALVRPDAITVEPVAESSWTAALRLAPQPAAGEWLTRIVRIEPTPSGARLHTSEPDLAADVSLDDIAAHAFAVGRPVRLRVDPRAVRLLVT
ncbi:sulfate/molybdate ABC transporter ATP-binding protein [Microbacterium telephonicum]|uniref:Molybdate transport system ATP-binding protein n=1 Tax=Microbacterium telephonicum TaxID=1714841 RepID=A0A498CJ36_9MICO|nr:ABC transporter ATP-binding protein [Microbacterium telephonicum]RLK52930.1 molybdate transport system ATP-binding protein [Microbacterium telephonicum]